VKITKTYKYRLRLSKKQSETLDNWINTSRAIYNVALETKIYAYQTHKVSLSKFDLMKQLTECRKEFDWVNNVPSQTLQDVIERMDKAYQTFFKGGGFPKFARKDRYNSITFKSIIQVSDYVFKLPKIGTVTIFKDRQPKGQLRRATVTRENDKYYISILTIQEQKPISISSDSQVGIDMGIVHFATLSNGMHIENPKYTKKYERKLRIEQRSLSRKSKGSGNWNKQKQRIAKLHTKIKNTRKDFLHKQSYFIVSNFNLIAVEDLKVKNMIKFGHLAKHINDASWSEFFIQLEYKSEWYGNTFVKVNPKYTSQTCSACGEVNSKSRISQSEFVCVKCGHIENADINASKEILKRGEGIAIKRKREELSCA